MPAPLSAPAEVPTTTSGTIPRSRSARSIPTWLTPWFPPPDSTNAVRGASGRRGARGRPPVGNGKRAPILGTSTGPWATCCDKFRLVMERTTGDGPGPFLVGEKRMRILRGDPSPAWSRSRVVTEFYRQYLAVAVFVVAAFGMVGAMLTIARILRPTLPQ